MLDIGILRLKYKINNIGTSFSINGTKPGTRINYSYSKNELTITFRYFFSNKISIKRLKNYFSQNSIKTFLSLTFNPLSVYFRHKGYKTKNEPANINEKLKNITKIKLIFQIPPKTKPYLKGIYPLNKDEFYWKELDKN